VKNKTIAVFLLLAAAAGVSLGWFESEPPPDDGPYGRVMITRVNTFETYLKSANVFATNASMVGVEFFDAGDVHPDITSQYGGNASDTFACAWPITIYVWFQTNSASVAEYHGYKTAKLQYFQGTDTGTSTNWTDIATITNFVTANGIEGAHFGLVTWYPPATNNVYYLIRVWAELFDGPQSALLTSTGITKQGTVDMADWNDYEVVLVKAIPYKKPGTRAIAPEPGCLGEPGPQDFPSSKRRGMIGSIMSAVGRAWRWAFGGEDK